LAQLAEDVELIGDGLPWTLSLLTGGGQTAVEWTAALEKDLWRIAEFAKRPPATMEVAALEVALPTACDPDTDSLGQLIETVLVQLAAAEIRPVALFFETTSAAHRAAVAKILGEQRPGGPRLGLKLRTGGLVAEHFPSPAELAEMIELCKTAQIPWKATAGLHHPLPRDCEKVGATMHGFLNLLAAVVLLEADQINPALLETILTDRQADHFVVSQTHLRWQQATASIDQIEAGRRRFISFGSCSFVEPLAELAALKLLAKAIP
jgi:hypothetical protein